MTKVYFADLRSRSHEENKTSKIKKLFETAGFKDCISQNDLTAIKIHFGEMGGDGFISPLFVRPIAEKIKESGAKPFITDSNTLYMGSRRNSADHTLTALRHGFGLEVTGAPVTIADGLRGNDQRVVRIDKKHFREAYIAGDVFDADSMVVMSHFKAHEMAGFGGAIKNLAMGCASVKGKSEQHSLRPFINQEKCINCGRCRDNCPQGAISTHEGTSEIKKEKCIGCAECMTVCSVRAIELDWTTDIREFTERLTEYAYAAVKGKENKTCYVNFLMDIAPDCDCVPWSDAPIVPDIGILVSKDPVALDQACLDLVNRETPARDTFLTENRGTEGDYFRALRPNTRGEIQLEYGEQIGLGNRDYEVINI